MLGYRYHDCLAVTNKTAVAQAPFRVASTNTNITQAPPILAVEIGLEPIYSSLTARRTTIVLSHNNGGWVISPLFGVPPTHYLLLNIYIQLLQVFPVQLNN